MLFGHDGACLYAGMSDGSPPTDEVRLILQRHRRLAVVGLSPRPDRPSHRAMVHMAANGYEITPVNPACDEVMGNACVASLEPPRWGRSRSSTSSAGPRTSPNRR